MLDMSIYTAIIGSVAVWNIQPVWIEYIAELIKESIYK